jgi:hypothetical protein
VCRFEGDLIVEVRAYLDSAMVTYTVLRNESSQACGAAELEVGRGTLGSH